MWIKTIFVCTFALGFSASTLFGNIYTNIAKPAEPGQLSVAAGLSQLKRDFEATVTVTVESQSGTASFDGDFDYSEFLVIAKYGLSESSELQGRLGQLTIELEDTDDLEGIEYGVGYRHMFDAGDGDVGAGLFISYMTAQLDSSLIEGDYTLIEAALGAGKNTDTITLYVAAIYSQLDVKLDATDEFLEEIWVETGFLLDSVTYEFEEADTFGVFAGAEVAMSDSIGIGFEIHAMFETGFALYVDGTF